MSSYGHISFHFTWTVDVISNILDSKSKQEKEKDAEMKDEGDKGGQRDSASSCLPDVCRRNTNKQKEESLLLTWHA